MFEHENCVGWSKVQNVFLMIFESGEGRGARESSVLSWSFRQRLERIQMDSCLKFSAQISAQSSAFELRPAMQRQFLLTWFGTFWAINLTLERWIFISDTLTSFPFFPKGRKNEEGGTGVHAWAKTDLILPPFCGKDDKSPLGKVHTGLLWMCEDLEIQILVIFKLFFTRVILLYLTLFHTWSQ